MRLAIENYRTAQGMKCDVVDLDRDGGGGRPLIVARFFEPEYAAALVAFPALLAAAKRLLAALGEGGRKGRGVDVVDPRPVEAMRAAVKAAGGEQATQGPHAGPRKAPAYDRRGTVPGGSGREVDAMGKAKHAPTPRLVRVLRLLAAGHRLEAHGQRTMSGWLYRDGGQGRKPTKGRRLSESDMNALYLDGLIRIDHDASWGQCQMYEITRRGRAAVKAAGGE